MLVKMISHSAHHSSRAYVITTIAGKSWFVLQKKKNDPFGNEENVLVGALVTGVALGKFMPNLYNKLFYQQNHAFFPELIHDDY